MLLGSFHNIRKHRIIMFYQNFTMTHPSCMALHGMSHSSTELHKPLRYNNAVIHVSVSVQLLCRVRFFATPRTAACQASLSITISQSLLKLMSLGLVLPSTISSSVIPFSSCSQSFPTSGSFQMSQLFASGSQSIGVSASASVLPMNTQD